MLNEGLRGPTSRIGRKCEGGDGVCVVPHSCLLGFCVCVDVQCGVCGKGGGLDGVGSGDGMRRGWKVMGVCEGRNDGLMW